MPSVANVPGNYTSEDIHIMSRGSYLKSGFTILLISAASRAASNFVAQSSPIITLPPQWKDASIELVIALGALIKPFTISLTTDGGPFVRATERPDVNCATLPHLDLLFRHLWKR
ncbi:hypothetical protein CEXT_412451 [Caerostris extrusa]|uniref:Uncharacterized protein n=1 Tax=Caerostris extrusa TaxID=172846 RepID=A0AAV4SZE7_CAEEX|nr:hypothetical protein CEXT_412451 [Caerostris extrusa]